MLGSANWCNTDEDCECGCGVAVCKECPTSPTFWDENGKWAIPIIVVLSIAAFFGFIYLIGWLHSNYCEDGEDYENRRNRSRIKKQERAARKEAEKRKKDEEKRKKDAEKL